MNTQAAIDVHVSRVAIHIVMLPVVKSAFCETIAGDLALDDGSNGNWGELAANCCPSAMNSTTGHRTHSGICSSMNPLPAGCANTLLKMRARSLPAPDMVIVPLRLRSESEYTSTTESVIEPACESATAS